MPHGGNPVLCGLLTLAASLNVHLTPSTCFRGLGADFSLVLENVPLLSRPQFLHPSPPEDVLLASGFGSYEQSCPEPLCAGFVWLRFQLFG